MKICTKCIDCGKDIWPHAIRCKSCNMKNSWKTKIISIDTRKEINPLVPSQKFYNLTVIKFSYKKRYPSGAMTFMYECRCDCGKIRIVNKQNLRDGSTRSCGCYHVKRTVEWFRDKYGDSSINHLFSNSQNSAKRRNIVWKLTREQYVKLILSNCFYCGEKPHKIANAHKKFYFGAVKHNGIDRINSQRGYVIGNVVSCCLYCNFAKNDLSLKNFLKHIKKMYKYNFGDKSA